MPPVNGLEEGMPHSPIARNDVSFITSAVLMDNSVPSLEVNIVNTTTTEQLFFFLSFFFWCFGKGVSVFDLAQVWPR